ncbi:MAG: hypothetical protein ABEJ85_03870 [Haloarculaceae archaeon]
MSEERKPPERADRVEPVGEPVVRADPEVTGSRADEAVGFDPDDDESLALAADTVRRFAEDTEGTEDNVYMLRGAAACAALVRGVGSYKAAAERAGGAVTVEFVRKWARVHDLPQAVRRHVARGHIAPTAAKHIARVGGEARFALAWATIDADLTVREVRQLASRVSDGVPVRRALVDAGVDFGRIDLQLPPETYRELRWQASLRNKSPSTLAAEALSEYLEE